MTYRELAMHLGNLNDEQLDSDVTILLEDSEEWIAVDRIDITEEDDVLDVGHPVLTILF